MTRFIVPVRWKFVLVVLIPIGLFLLVSIFYLQPRIVQNVYNVQKLQSQDLIDVGWSVLHHFHELEQTTEMTREQAQTQAKMVLQSINYGEAGRNYYWINDYDPNLLLHPLLTELARGDIDYDLTTLMQQFVALVSAEESGFVSYQWPTFEDSTIVQPKMSYVRDFAPWGWVLGTGIFRHDLDQIVQAQQQTITWGAVGALIMGIFSYLLALGITKPLSAMAQRLTGIAQEDLALNLPADILGRSDEIGSLARSLQWMKESLQNTITLLHKNEEDLAITLESIGDAVIATDANGCITRMNTVAQQLTGWSQTEAYGKPMPEVFQIIHTKSRVVCEDPVAKVLTSGVTIGLANHTSLLAKDGTEYQIADSAAPIKDALGVVQGVVLVFRDVTEEYRKHALMIQSEQRFRSLFENSMSGIALHEIICDAQGNPVDYRFLAVNTAFEVLTGLKATEIIDKTVMELMPDTEKVWIQAFGNVALTGESVELEQFSQSLGKYFSVRAYQPKPHQFVAVFYDVTNQKNTLNALQEKSQELEDFFAVSLDLLCIAEDTGRFLKVNRAWEATLGYSMAELLQASCLDFVHPDDLNATLSVVGRLQKRKKVHNFVNRYRCKNGEYLYLEWNSFLKNDRLYAAARDITERRELVDELECLTYQDVLTGLHNRRYLEQELERLNYAPEKLPITVIMADVNGLKIVNDSLGHAEGDRLLRAVATKIRSACIADCQIGRWGGDEFVMILTNTTQEQVEAVCSRTACSSEEGFDAPIALSIALGYATKTTLDQDIMDVLKEAENDMYRHKSTNAHSSRSALVTSLQRTLQEKSHETEQHARNIQTLAMNLGKRLCLVEREINEISLLALLHDLGKVAIPESILRKPGPLSPEEWEIMSKHPEIGHRIAIASPDLVAVADGILSHHERWDGGGYPRGLKQEEILLAARIVTIVDSFEAMTGDRVYRQGMSVEEALVEIANCAGTQFDPEIAKEFLQMMKEQ